MTEPQRPAKQARPDAAGRQIMCVSLCFSVHACMCREGELKTKCVYMIM
jgi:hypothetical protein